MAEGAPLLREYGFKKPIEGSNPSLSAKCRYKQLKTLTFIRWAFFSTTSSTSN